ncbi:MAG: class I SAM-dependent methyltransferase [Pseudomonadota bacterium]
MSNTEQIDYWSGETGITWVETQDAIDAMMAPITAELLRRIPREPTEQVLDIGCGCGTSTLALAPRVRQITGVDVSPPMLAAARERAAGTDNIEFIEADAAAARFPHPFDRAISRFGVMFFDAPGAAFGHLRSQLRPGGQLQFVCWASPRDNGWLYLAAAAVKPFVPPPDPPPDPKAPGPFAFADPADIQRYLEQAGYGDITIEAYGCDLTLGADLDAAVAFQSRIGPLSRALKLLEEPDRSAALSAVREALTPFAGADGVQLPGQVWFVTAQA